MSKNRLASRCSCRRARETDGNATVEVLRPEEGRGGYSADSQSQEGAGRLCRPMVFDLLWRALNEANPPSRVVDQNFIMNAHTFQATMCGMDKSASIMIGHGPIPPLLVPL